eukprot:TRINITY_DN2539_c0_g2_i2.p1 TRINITY_DN2539_c0_g2~~TRINITY_DN2539_c0_g2_i2.p1  ORF type:complete len:1198 (+),score=392.63 TRINITY_DN2539_c0_g2_i2:210-3803(+)
MKQIRPKLFLRDLLFYTLLFFSKSCGKRSGIEDIKLQQTLFVGGEFTAYSGTSAISSLVQYIEQPQDPDSGAFHSFSPGSPKKWGMTETVASNGTLIYVGGSFNEVAGTAISNIAVYNTTSNVFSPLCGGVDGPVYSIAVFKDTIIIGGAFSSAVGCDGQPKTMNSVAKFNVTEQTFYAISDGIANAVVNTLDIYQPVDRALQLYVAGYNLYPQAAFIMKYDFGNQVWEKMGTGNDHSEAENKYNVIAVFQGGESSEPAIYIGGTFSNISGADTPCIAQWSGEPVNAWMPMGTGLGGFGNNPITVNAIEFMPIAGSDNDYRVIVGGFFQTAGNATVRNIAFYNGTTWLDMMGGIGDSDPGYENTTVMCGVVPAEIWSISAIDNESLIVSGMFVSAGNSSLNNVAIFNFTDDTWRVMGDDTPLTNTILLATAVMPTGQIYTFGSEVIGQQYNKQVLDQVVVAVWVENQWTRLLENPTDTFLDVAQIYAIVQNGSEIYVGGRFVTVGGKVINNIAVWDLDASTWSSVGEGIQGGVVYSLFVQDEYLYIGGKFNYTAQGNIRMEGIARWSKRSGKFDTMGGARLSGANINGVIDCSFENSIFAIAGDTDTKKVFFGGSFASVDVDFPNISVLSPNTAVYNVAANSWGSLANGVGGDGEVVHALLVGPATQNVVLHANVAGNVLYVGGQFSTVSMHAVKNLAMWDVTKGEWIVTDSGVNLSSVDPSLPAGIYAMALNGSLLIIGGRFQDVNGNIVNNIATQSYSNGQMSWNSVGLGVSDVTPAAVYAIAFDSDSGQLFAGGRFSNAGSNTNVDNLAKYLSPHWTSVENGISDWDGPVEVLLLDCAGNQKNKKFYQSALFYVIVVSSGVLVLAFFGGVLYHVARRHRKKRRNYVPIPSFTEKKKLSIGDVAKDSAIEQIPYAELELGARISFGASGEVIQGMWRKKGSKQSLGVAIKRVAWETNAASINSAVATQKFMEDFLYEIKIMSSLNHENILELLGVCITKTDDVLLVTEFMEHGSMRDLLNRSGGKVDWKLKIRLAIDAANGIIYLHSREPPIIHRDLKTSNLLIDNRFRCKIADFGISRMKSILTQSYATSLVGTPAYMSPEVISANKFSEAADSYSFGVVLTELWSGEAPYADTNLFPQQVMYAVVQEGLRPTIAMDCPLPLRLLIKDCLHTEPSMRPNFKEIKSRLKRMSEEA